MMLSGEKFVLVVWAAATFMVSVALCQTDSPSVIKSISPSTAASSTDNTEIYQWVVGVVSVLIAFTLLTIIGLLFRLFFHYVQERRLKRSGYLRSKGRRGKRRGERSQRAYVVATKRPPVPTLSRRVHVDEYGQPVVDDYGYIPPPPPHPPPAPPIYYQPGVVYNSGREFVPIVDSNPGPFSGGLLMTVPQPYEQQQIPQQLTNREPDKHVTRPSRLQRGPLHEPTIPEEDPQPNPTNQDALPQQQGDEHPLSTSKQQEAGELPREQVRRSNSAASVEDYGGWRRSVPDNNFVFGRRDSSRRSGSRSHRHHSGNRRDREDRDPLYQSLSPSVTEQAVVRNPIHAHGRMF